MLDRMDSYFLDSYFFIYFYLVYPMTIEGVSSLKYYLNCCNCLTGLGYTFSSLITSFGLITSKTLTSGIMGMMGLMIGSIIDALRG